MPNRASGPTSRTTFPSGGPSGQHTREHRDSVSREHGVALLVALIFTVVLGFLGLGLLTRALMVTRISGSERWSVKTFYAADAGINTARARLRIGRTQAFSFTISDLRLPCGSAAQDSPQHAGTIDVEVSELTQVGPPRTVIGTQVGGGQGGGVPLCIMLYRGTSTARQELVNSERVVSSTMAVGPLPPTITDQDQDQDQDQD